MSEQNVREILASRLKECRERASMTAAEVGIAIGKSGKTVSAWERGFGQPDADMLLKLCLLYKVKNIGFFYGMDAPADDIVSEEQALVKAFRNLSPEGRKLVLRTVCAIAGNPSMQKE